jgi:hypothetical protein
VIFASIPSRRAPEPVEKASIADIEALAASYEPKITKAILALLDQQGAALDLDKLAAALASGNVGAVMAMLVETFGTLSDALEDAIWAGGIAAAAAVNATTIGGTTFIFNRLNPFLIQWMQNYTLSLIREINASTREAVRLQITNGIMAGTGPVAQARQIKQIVGLTKTQAQAVANFRAELESFHLKNSAGSWNLGGEISRRNNRQVFALGPDGKPKDGILSRRLRDFRHDKALKAALESGKPLSPAKIDQMVAAYARKYRKYRAETIARTESMRAMNMGVQEGFRQAVVDGKLSEAQIRRYWKVAKDERTCETCSPVPKMNKTGVMMGEPFKTPKGPVTLPPLHPNCRCFIMIKHLEPEELAALK